MTPAPANHSLVEAPVRNTFIHYDQAVERPQKLRRVSSAPAKMTSVRVRNLSHEAVPTECQPFAPARKRARVAVGEAAGIVVIANSHGAEAAEQLQQQLPRGRSRTKCPRKSQTKSDGKELTEQARYEKAKEWIVKMKQTEGYKAFLESRVSGDEQALATPRTPDPALRLSSKRRWEKAILSWRSSLRRWGPVSVNGVDED